MKDLLIGMVVGVVTGYVLRKMEDDGKFRCLHAPPPPRFKGKRRSDEPERRRLGQSRICCRPRSSGCRAGKEQKIK